MRAFRVPRLMWLMRCVRSTLEGPPCPGYWKITRRVIWWQFPPGIFGTQATMSEDICLRRAKWANCSQKISLWANCSQKISLWANCSQLVSKLLTTREQFSHGSEKTSHHSHNTVLIFSLGHHHVCSSVTSKSTGKLLTFLTAHCLCSQNGWSVNIKVPTLQPLQNVPTFSSTIKHAGRVCPWVTFADAPQQWRHPAVCLEAWWHGKNKHCLCFGIHEHKRCKDFEQLNAMILFDSVFLMIYWDIMFIPFDFLAAELPTWRDD